MFVQANPMYTQYVYCQDCGVVDKVAIKGIGSTTYQTALDRHNAHEHPTRRATDMYLRILAAEYING